MRKEQQLEEELENGKSTKSLTIPLRLGLHALAKLKDGEILLTV